MPQPAHSAIIAAASTVHRESSRRCDDDGGVPSPDGLLFGGGTWTVVEILLELQRKLVR